MTPVTESPRTINCREAGGKPAVIAAVDALRPGEKIVVVSDHAPRPLLAALQAERKGLFEWSPLQEGPEVWRTEIERRDAGLGAQRTVTEALAWDHDRLEDVERRAFEARAAGDLEGAQAAFGEFAHGLRRHIRFEEEILFAAFEERSGLSPEMGPTAVMRMEHREIEDLLSRIADSIGRPEATSLELRGALHRVLGQHNTKEEMVLYPGTDEMLAPAERDELVGQIQRS